LSGDNEADRKSLSAFFPFPERLRFNQSPHHKLDYVKALQASGRKVMMVGDGLNDAVALKQSDLGVAVTDNINNFNPGCDAILDGNSMAALPRFIQQAKDAAKTIRMSLLISATYNLVGVYYAMQGTMSPLTAAVLMPMSTVTIIIFTFGSTRYFANKNKLPWSY
jgi:Cu+-exporting ATPase